MAQKIDILGLKIDSFTLQEALARVEEIIAARKPEYFSRINRLIKLFASEFSLTLDGLSISSAEQLVSARNAAGI